MKQAWAVLGGIKPHLFVVKLRRKKLDDYFPNIIPVNRLSKPY